ncbi:unnamed protein product [Echinostoma caproni]|uniref:Uncharacterized protein n=1 Tax=Echinostoma caproni TaxID=27848 RepID=A0A183BB92_9TREM|nr:unnamed protein product [Echinostoma caproni]
MDSTEPSDAESAAESDDPDSHRDASAWTTSPFHNGDRGIQSPDRKRPRTTRPMADLKVPSSSGFVCRRSGSAGVGSLLVFRLHAALSDDGKALVHLLTSCLADLPSRTSSPLCTPIHPTAPNPLGSNFGEAASNETLKRRWRGPTQVENSLKLSQSKQSSTSSNSSKRSKSKQFVFFQ